MASVYESMTPEKRTERAKKAAAARWAKTASPEERAAQTLPARTALLEKVKTADPDHFRRMAEKSVEVRRAKRDAAA